MSDSRPAAAAAAASEISHKLICIAESINLSEKKKKIPSSHLPSE
jgi:hypothetical protein